jgi:hypothetical protein
MNTHPVRPITTLSALALALLLGACGAGSVDDIRADTQPTAKAKAQVQPSDPGARTRANRYVTPAQAAQLEDTLGAKAIPVNVEPGPDAAAAVELATQIVWGLQAAHDLRADAPVLVRSADLRLGATLANRLGEGGYTNVFLVVR